MIDVAESGRSTVRASSRTLTASSVAAWFRILRVENIALTVGLYFVGLSYSLSAPGLVALLVGPAVVASNLAMGNVFNDLMDYNIDSIGKPWRPLPSGRIQRRTAAKAVAFLAAGSVVFAVGLGSAGLGVFAIVMTIQSIVYSLLLKRVPFLGHVSVAVQVSLAIVFGSLAGGSLTKGPVILAACVAAGYFIYELTKGASDRWHDAMFIKTAATIMGSKGTASLLRTLCAVDIVLLGALTIVGEISAIAGIALVLPVLPIAHFLIRRDNRSVDEIQPALSSAKLAFLLTLLGLALGG